MRRTDHTRRFVLGIYGVTALWCVAVLLLGAYLVIIHFLMPYSTTVGLALTGLVLIASGTYLLGYAVERGLPRYRRFKRNRKLEAFDD